MQGVGQDFYFINSQDTFDVYAISTMSGNNMMYLLPQNSGQIVAVAQTDVPFIFRVTPATPQPPPTLAAR